MNAARQNRTDNAGRARCPDHLYDHRAVPGLRDPDQQLQDPQGDLPRTAGPARRRQFPLIGYETVLKQGDFFLYFQNSMIVTVVSLFFILLFGAMAAFALAEYRFKGNTLMGLYLALGIMIPIRIGTVAILEMMVSDRACEHALGADPGLHRARSAAGGLHPVGVHEGRSATI